LKKWAWFVIIKKLRIAGGLMDGKIEIRSGKENGYTAKEAMKLAVGDMKAKTAHVVSVIALEEKHWDSESVLFVKMFLRFLHKNRDRIFLLAENDEMLYKVEKSIAENNADIRIVERATMEGHGVSDDMILNQINGAEAECIIASLPAEVESQFLEKYQTALDARIWLSIGTNLKWKKKPKDFKKFWERILQHFTKNKV